MYTFVKDLNQEEFNQFADNYPYASLLQSYQWSTVKSNFKPLHVGVKKDGEVVATALILIRSLPLKMKFAYLPRGPLCDFQDTQLLSFFVKEIKKICKENGCFFIRLDPAIPYKAYLVEDKENAQPLESGKQAINALTNQGFKHRGFSEDMHDSFQPRTVAALRINADTEKNYTHRLKKSIKYTEKRLTEISKGHIEYLDELATMVKLTEERQGVHLRNSDYFKLLLETYPHQSQITLASLKPKQLAQIFENEIDKRKQEIEKIKEKSPKKVFSLNEQISSFESLLKELDKIIDQDEIVIGALLSITYAKTIYLLYAGTDVNYTKFYPQELIYHRIVQQSVENDLHYMDMGGVQGSLDDGLFIFKSQFNPEIHEYIGEFDLPLNFKYKLFNLAWSMRNKLRKKRS